MSPSGYSGTPLARKLGIKPGSTVTLVGAPKGFTSELVDLPAGVKFSHSFTPTPDLAIWFVSSKREVEGRMPEVARVMGAGLWVAWPKKASGIVTDVNENVIRNAGLAQGIVDYKVCAINEIWSGLKFARRKSSAR